MTATESKIVTLAAGEYFYLERRKAAALLRSGAADVYAATPDHKERLFLVSRQAGDYAFPLCDEFQSLEIYLLAREDCELLLYAEEELADNAVADMAAVRGGLRGWFQALLTLPWLRFFAVRNDDYVGRWDKSDFLADVADEQLWLVFLEHQNILALLLSGQFNSLRKYFAERLQKRRQKKERLLQDAVSVLTGEEAASGSQGLGQAEGLTLLARKIAEFFHMETEAIFLPQELQQRQEKLALLSRLLGKGGIRLRRVTLEAGWQDKDCGALLVRQGGEWQAALPCSPGKYFLWHADGSKQELTEALAGQLEPAGYICYAGFPQRALKLKDLLLFMFHQCWSSDYRTILLASFIAGLLPLLTPMITQSIFSDIIPIGDRQGLTTLTQVIMVAGFTTAAISLARAVAVLRVSSHLNMAVEAALWSRLLSLPAEFFKRYETGELAGRMSAMDAVKSFVTGDFVSGVFNTVFSLWSVLLMCYYSVKMTLLALLVWLVYFLVMAFVYRRVFEFQRNLVNASNKTSAKVVQIFNGLAKFRIQGAEEQAFYMWASCFGEEWKWNLKLRWQSNYSMIINAVQPLILCLLLYYTAAKGLETQQQGAASAMSYAEFIGFQAAFSSFNTMLTGMIPLVAQFYSVRPHIENLRPLLETVPEQTDDRLEPGRLSGEIEARHLSFAYSKDGPEVLKDLNLFINAGESVAIVGRSGCGKSTLMRLLLGFEKPTRGAVYYDNMDLSELNPASVRSQLGVVLQDGKLMAGSILENIVGTSAMTMEDAWEAAASVGLEQDIAEMPMQMHTVISEGSGNISGGQRQRILLARSIVNKPRVLLLDEATSALDNTTQAIVSKTLEQMHCTRVIIAHRLSTIKNVDRILVMDAGRIVEEGTYKELLERGGIFSSLARRQLA